MTEVQPGPEVRLSEDKNHLVWIHECNFQDLKGHTRHEVPLPIDPELGWVVQSEDPLTVTPSILCVSCKAHGFWTEGKWRAA